MGITAVSEVARNTFLADHVPALWNLDDGTELRAAGATFVAGNGLVHKEIHRISL